MRRPRPAAVAWLLCVLLPACLARWSAEVRSTVVEGQAVPFAQSVVLADAPPHRKLVVQTKGLRVSAQVTDLTLCVEHRGMRIARTQHSETDFPAWAWAAWATEVAVVGGAGWLAAGATARDGVPEAVGSVAGPAAIGLGIAAIVELTQLLGWGHAPRDEPLPPKETLQPPTLVVCGRTTPAGIAVTAASEHTAVQAYTVGDSADFDAATWPATGFPYAAPFAKIHCERAESLPLFLHPAAAAGLVLARNGLHDLETWLYLHGGDPAAVAVGRRRDAHLAQLRALQEEALREARLAFGEGDLTAAAGAARRCLSVAHLAAPACQRMLLAVDDQFIVQQLAAGRSALVRQDFAAAARAVYRCLLVDRTRPSCLAFQAEAAAAEKALAVKTLYAAIAAADAPAARAALDRCLQISTDDSEAPAWRAALATLENRLAVVELQTLHRRGKAWLRQRKWARALVLLDSCRDSAPACPCVKERQQCALLAQRARARLASLK